MKYLANVSVFQPPIFIISSTLVLARGCLLGEPLTRTSRALPPKELLSFLGNNNIRTRNFRKPCTMFIAVPGTSVSVV